MGNTSSVSNDNEIFTSSPTSTSSLPQSDTLIEIESLRQKARQFQIEAKKTSDQSQYEYQHGDKAKAKILSEKKQSLYSQMNETNCRAAQLVFDHYNQKRPMDEIDLHGLYVTEALQYLQKKVDECRLKRILQLKVITGIGNHSPQNIARIKPKVEQFAHKNHLKIDTFAGHVMLDLTPTKYPTSKDSCIIL